MIFLQLSIGEFGSSFARPVSWGKRGQDESHGTFHRYYPANKMLADCRQTGSRFDQKISAGWHQLRSHSASVLSTEPVHIVRQQIGSRNQAEPADRIWRQIGGRNPAGSAAFI